METRDLVDAPPRPASVPREVATTARLRLRRLDDGDAGFIHVLVNDPDWLRYIGDRGVRTLEDARGYIARGPVAMYEQLGYGLFAVELRDSARPIGICGVLKRDGLDDVDLGFAFLPAYRAQGYALEAAAATLAWARETRGLRRVLAITSQDNDASGRLLRRLGFRLERTAPLQPDAEAVHVYALELE